MSKMKFGRFFLCLLFLHIVTYVNGVLLKHLTHPKPGGIIEALTKPKIPVASSHAGSHFGLSLGVGSFGLNFGFQKQYIPPGGGGNLPPKDPHVPGGIPGFPGGNPHIPGVNPGYPGGNPYIPGGNPYAPGGNPYVPGGNPYAPGGNPYGPGGNPYGPGGKPYEPTAKPYFPEENPHNPGEEPYGPGGKPYVPEGNPHSSVDPEPYVPEEKHQNPKLTWEDEKQEKGRPYYPRPNKHKDESGYSKPGPYEVDRIDKPKYGSYEDEAKDSRPDWEDIGEDVSDNDSKAENFMEGDLTGTGLIQPRNRNKNRSKRFIQSRIIHVPLTFESNAKPFKVKIINKLNSLIQES